MSVTPRSELRVWLKASRPPSNINLVLPLLLGQALAYADTGAIRWDIFLLVMLYGWAQQLAIVFWNDYFDREADAINTGYTMFSGGSRVLPDGDLTPAQLKRAGVYAAAGVLCLAGVVTWLGRPLFLPMALGGLMLIALYSAPPWRLNYRGGGELLQGLGCGGLLPVMAYYAQADGFGEFPWLLLIPFMILHTCSSIATSLPDVPADRDAGKRTVATMGGVRFAAGTALVLAFGAVSSSVLFTPWQGPWAGAFQGGCLALLLAMVFTLGDIAHSAGAQLRYMLLMTLMIALYALGYILGAVM